jgi:hypothetical protein
MLGVAWEPPAQCSSAKPASQRRARNRRTAVRLCQPLLLLPGLFKQQLVAGPGTPNMDGREARAPLQGLAAKVQGAIHSTSDLTGQQLLARAGDGIFQACKEVSSYM